MKFHHCWPTPGKCLSHHLEKSTNAPPPGKHLSDESAPLRVDQGFSNFWAHVPLSIKRIISRHLVYAGVIIQFYK